MDAEFIAQCLSAVPLHSVDEARGSAPKESGFYAWWCELGVLPTGVPVHPHPNDHDYSLLYVGIAPNGPGRKSDLRKRLCQHTGSNIGGSTLRMGLTALLWRDAGWRPDYKGRAHLTKPDKDSLLAWQRENLRVQWCEVAEPWGMGLEASVIRLMKPPLNREHNVSHAYYPAMGSALAGLRTGSMSTGQLPAG